MMHSDWWGRLCQLWHSRSDCNSKVVYSAPELMINLLEMDNYIDIWHQIDCDSSGAGGRGYRVLHTYRSPRYLYDSVAENTLT